MPMAFDAVQPIIAKRRLGKPRLLIRSLDPASPRTTEIEAAAECPHKPRFARCTCAFTAFSSIESARAAGANRWIARMELTGTDTGRAEVSGTRRRVTDLVLPTVCPSCGSPLVPIDAVIGWREPSGEQELLVTCRWCWRGGAKEMTLADATGELGDDVRIISETEITGRPITVEDVVPGPVDAIGAGSASVSPPPAGPEPAATEPAPQGDAALAAKTDAFLAAASTPFDEPPSSLDIDAARSSATPPHNDVDNGDGGWPPPPTGGRR